LTTSASTLVYTGQNYDDRLSQVFFDEMSVRAPDVHMGVRAASAAGQIGQILERSEALFLQRRPDRLLILGDTNSGLAAIIARRLGLPVYHMEAGNRCYDDRVPEEVNRRVIDHSSSVLMPYTERSRENLIAEGFSGNRLYVTGNPIKQIIDHYSERISASAALDELGLEPGKFFLVTIHRAENVDIESRLRSLVEALELLRKEFGFPIVCSLHPRTRSKMDAFGVHLERAGISFLEPLGFFDFVRLEQSAFCLLSDSGTVQEETCIFGVPNVTLRDVTERPETIECGSNVLCGVIPAEILGAVRMVTAQSSRWKPPEEYMAPAVAETVCRIVLGYRPPDMAELEWRKRPGTR